jgi:hypothetical protein
MILRHYQSVLYTNSGPKRPFAKALFGKSIEDVIYEWENNKDALSDTEQTGTLFHYRFDFIDWDLFKQDTVLDGIDLSFSQDMKYCIIRKKHIPSGKVRELFELEIYELDAEEVLSPQDEAFILKLKEFREKDYASRLSICSADISAIQAIDQYFNFHETSCEYIPELWSIHLEQLEPNMDVPIVRFSTYGECDLFALAVRSAIYATNSIEEAIELANSVFKECGCGRRLTDEELLIFGVDVEDYHKEWPHCYIGEKQ